MRGHVLTHTRTRHLPALGALRFLMALWVMMAHVQLPTFGHGGSLPLRGALALLYGYTAVLVFFVISGLCIHYPYRSARRVELVPFYARRHVRILVPAVMALLLAYTLGVPLVRMVRGPFWTLFCEEVYYTVYPLTLRARRAVGWFPLLAGFVVLSLALSLGVGVGAQGLSVTLAACVLLFPVWLAGAWLAEHLDFAGAPSVRRVWSARVLVLVVVLLMRLAVRAGVPMAAVALPFALVAVWWLRCEIGRAVVMGAPRIESLGAISYSLYLVHQPMHWWFQTRVFGVPLVSDPLAWLVAVCTIVAAAIVFYLVVERPSHQLARWLYDRLRRRFPVRDVSDPYPDHAPQRA